MTIIGYRDIETNRIIKYYIVEEDKYIPVDDGNFDYRRISKLISSGSVTYKLKPDDNELLSIIKEQLYSKLKNEFYKVQEKFTIYSKTLQTNVDAGRIAYANVCALIDYLSDDTTTVKFRVSDNSFIDITRTDLINLKKELIAAGLQLYQKKWNVENLIKNLTIDDVVHYKIDVDLMNETLNKTPKKPGV